MFVFFFFNPPPPHTHTSKHNQSHIIWLGMGSGEEKQYFIPPIERLLTCEIKLRSVQVITCNVGVFFGSWPCWWSVGGSVSGLAPSVFSACRRLSVCRGKHGQCWVWRAYLLYLKVCWNRVLYSLLFKAASSELLPGSDSEGVETHSVQWPVCSWWMQHTQPQHWGAGTREWLVWGQLGLYSGTWSQKERKKKSFFVEKAEYNFKVKMGNDHSVWSPRGPSRGALRPTVLCNQGRGNIGWFLHLCWALSPASPCFSPSLNSNWIDNECR